MDLLSELLSPRSGLKVNWRNPYDSLQSALHAACGKGHAAAVDVLLTRPDIDVNLRDAIGCTPLLLACYSENLSVVKILLEVFLASWST